MCVLVGVGVFVGYDFKMWGKCLCVNLFVVKVMLFDLEIGELCGVVIWVMWFMQCFVEGYDDWEFIKYDDKVVVDVIVKVINLLFEYVCVVFEQWFDVDMLWNVLVQYCGESGGSGGILISWVDQIKKCWCVLMDVSVGMNVCVSSLYMLVWIGLLVWLCGEKMFSNMVILQEKIGMMCVEQFSVVMGYKVMVWGGLVFLVGCIFYMVVFDDNVLVKVGESGKFIQLFIGGMLFGFNWKFLEGGYMMKVKMGYQNGKIVDCVSYFDIEYCSVCEYLVVVCSECDVWINMFVYKLGGILEQVVCEFEVYCEIVEKYVCFNQCYLNWYWFWLFVVCEIEGYFVLVDLYWSIDLNFVDV